MCRDNYMSGKLKKNKVKSQKPGQGEAVFVQKGVEKIGEKALNITSIDVLIYWVVIT